MNLINFSLILIGLLFGLYAVCASIETGVVLRMAARDQASRRLFTPLWELTNVLLVFGFTALAMLFNGALNSLSQALLATLGVALFALLLRACVVLTIFYVWRHDILPNWLTCALAAGTLLVPLSFAAAGVFMLTGQNFWQSLLGWVLMVTALLGLVAPGLLYLNRRSAKRQALFGELSFALWLLLMGCVLPLSVVHTSNDLQQWPVAVLTLASAVGLFWLMLSFISRRSARVWWGAMLLALAAPSLLAWADRPYLIAGKLTLAAAWGAQAYGRAIVIGLAAMLPLLLVGFYVFWRLFADENQPLK